MIEFFVLLTIILVFSVITHVEPMIEYTKDGLNIWYNKYGRRSKERTYKNIRWK